MRAFTQTWLVLSGKELRSHFLSPLGYVVMALVLLMFGVSYRFALDGMAGKVSQYSLVYLTFNSFWFWMIYFLIFPLITMKSFAEEKRSGTAEQLFTAPVTAWEVVLGKYSAALAFYLAIWLPTMLNFVAFDLLSGTAAAFAPGGFWGTYLILFLVGAMNLAMGVFASSLTSSQVVAGVLGFCLVTVHFFLGFSHQMGTRISAEVMERVRYFSTFEHFRGFSHGLIDSRPVVYYLSMTVLFLFLTHAVVESRRWR
jgi:ABC-2 type transport system permease protein